MKKLLLFNLLTAIIGFSFVLFPNKLSAQSCVSSGGCSIADTNATGQYPSSTFSTSSSAWTTVSAYMNAGNYTLFNVTSGHIYEWTYCSNFGGSQGWDAELTLFDNTGSVLCYEDNSGLSGCANAPYIRWTATYTGKAKLLTTVSGCITNTGSPYATLVWRDATGAQSGSVLGIDVSHYQGTINWTQVKSDGIIFAWVKSTEGTTYTDPSFATYITNGESAGVKMGVYHFARPDNNSAADEVTHFLNVSASYIAECKLTPVLDFETTTGCTYSYLTTWAEDWMSAVKTATGIAPVFYTSSSIASNLGSSLNIYPLWMANPGTSSTTPPASLGVWNDWAFKQYSWTGVVSGISGDVDMDVFNGDMTAFNNFIGCNITDASEILSEPDFMIYPNPATTNFTVKNISSNYYKEQMVLIYNMQGQLMLQQSLQDQQTEIDISNLSRGMYIVKIGTEFGVEVKKLVKE